MITHNIPTCSCSQCELIRAKTAITALNRKIDRYHAEVECEIDKTFQMKSRLAALEAENTQLQADKAEMDAAAEEVLDAIWETENGFSDAEKYLHELIEKHKEDA